MLTQYLAQTEYVLSQLRFTFEGGVYHGRGMAKWNPEIGFEIEAPVSRTGAEIGTMHFGFSGLIREEHLRPVWMRSGWERRSWIVAPRVLMVDRFDVVATEHLSIRVPSLVFSDPSGLPDRSDEFWYGSALFQIPYSSVFPDRVFSQTMLGSHRLTASVSSSGFDYEGEDGLKLTGRKSGEEYFEVAFRLPRLQWTRAEAWKWPAAFRDALAISLDSQVHLLQRTVDRGVRSYKEITRKEKKLTSLELWPLLGRQRIVEKQELVQLSYFYARNNGYAEVARLMFAQMLAAASQRNYQARELLTSTVLEASLRTLYGYPFSPKDRSFEMRRVFFRFVADHLGEAWREYAERVLRIYFRLRDRNAHPDWLFSLPDGAGQRIDRGEALADSRALAQLYGYMILALAGVRLPEPPPACRS